MIRGARTQAADVRTDVLVRVPTATLEGRVQPVAGGRAVLEIDHSGQPVGIKRTVERR